MKDNTINVAIFEMLPQGLSNVRVTHGGLTSGDFREARAIMARLLDTWSDNGKLYGDETHIVYIASTTGYAVFAVTKSEDVHTNIVISAMCISEGMLWADINDTCNIIEHIYTMFGKRPILTDKDTLDEVGMVPEDLGYEFEVNVLGFDTFYILSGDDISKSIRDRAISAR